ncbi:NAD(P)H-binding protein [Pleomorphomonas sp. PLEO]|uniref:NAD(P)H-binding protein n=1 Tax=Pleomorphomonas sp. PLEO TaxID=3239306 RepID=UPI00351DE90C
MLVRPAVQSDKPGRDKIRVLTDLSGFHGGGISRADVARFVLDQVEGDAWLR